MLSTTSRTLKRCLGTTLLRKKHTLPDLKYDFNALEPYISADIMKLHYEKHHQAYVNNLNVAEEKLNAALAKGDISAIVSLQQAIKFNGGGHINHTIFWSNLSPKGGGEPTGDLLQQIKDEYSTFENMKKILAEKSVAIQGSGWGWLGFDKTKGKLSITTCSNQDPLEGTTGLTPLFGIDVWEHAYYLQYKNVRADYVNAIFKIANWKDVSDRLAAARLKN